MSQYRFLRVVIIETPLLTGLEMQEAQGFNPYKMGAIGASDTHLSAAPFEENEYFTR